MTLRVDENTDFTCDRVWRDEDVTIKSFAISPTDQTRPTPTSTVMPDGQTVKVQGVEAKVDYDIRFEYVAPQELTQTVDRPVFRLELFRPQAPKKSGQTGGG